MAGPNYRPSPGRVGGGVKMQPNARGVSSSPASGKSMAATNVTLPSKVDIRGGAAAGSKTNGKGAKSSPR